MTGWLHTNKSLTTGRSRRHKSLLLACAATLLVWVFSHTAVAASKQAIGLKVYEELQEVQLLIDADQFQEATTALQTMLETHTRLNDYERAQIWALQGNVYFQMEDYDRALQAFETVVTFQELPEGFVLVSLRTLAQLCFMQERLDDALTYAQRVIQLTETPDPGAHVLTAKIYFRMENFPAALEQIERAIQLHQQTGAIPPENWLLVANAIHYNMGNYERMVETLKILVQHYTKDSYILNLAAIYGQLQKTDKQLLLMEPLYDQGRLKGETELLNLANLMLMHKVPYKGAKVIEYGFENGYIKQNHRNLELYSQSWQLAAEDDRSIEALVKAAKLDEEGTTDLQLAQSYIGLYRWDEAEASLEKALEKGSLKKPGDAQVLLGMVRFYQQRYYPARQAFLAAAKYEDTADLSEKWLLYLDQEISKAEAIEEALSGKPANTAQKNN